MNIGDRFVAYLSGNRFFATGSVISPRRGRGPNDAVDDVEAYVKRKDSHSRDKGFVYYTPVLYENFDDKWRIQNIEIFVTLSVLTSIDGRISSLRGYP